MLTYDMSARGEDPLYVYLCKRIRADIESGAIAPHEKLPSKRSLARNLDVGVITVEAAYAQLIAEGYLYAESRRGYFVSDIQAPRGDGAGDAPDADAAPSPASPAPASRGRGEALRDRTAQAAATPAHPRPWERSRAMQQRPAQARPQRSANVRFDLRPGSFAHDLFPAAAWARALRVALSDGSSESSRACDDPRGTERLRRAIAHHLAKTRGLAAEPDRIVVGATKQILCAMIAHLVDRPAVAGIEDADRGQTADIYRMCGIETADLILDGGAVDADALEKAGATLAHVSPSHRFPEGTSMPAARRYELLAWAAASPERTIVEDDRDGEFRLAGTPLPTLQGIDEHGRVIHLGDFSHAFGPMLRLAYMVLPARLAETFQAKFGSHPCTAPVIEQTALAWFIEQGELERFVNRRKTACRNTRDALIAAMMKTPAASHIGFENIDAGLHFVMRIDARPAASRKTYGTQAARSAFASHASQPHASGASAAYACRANGAQTHDEDDGRDPLSALEEAIAASLARQDVAAVPVSRYRKTFAAAHEADIDRNERGEAPHRADDGARIQCRLAIDCSSLPEKHARAAAEAIRRAIAPFM